MDPELRVWSIWILAPLLQAQEGVGSGHIQVPGLGPRALAYLLSPRLDALGQSAYL